MALVKCKDSVSGIKDFFLVPYIKYPKRLFLSTAYTFPNSQKLNIEFMKGANFTQTREEDGGFSQSFTFRTLKLNSVVLKDKEWRVIIRDNNNTYWMLGALNGLELTGEEASTGTEKNEFTGYSYTLSGKENERIFEITNLAPFQEGLVLFLASSEEPTSSNKLISETYI